MADSTASSKSRTLPNFYSAVGGMGSYSGEDGGASSAKSPARSGADSGEKVKNVTALLEVVKKMDSMESDPENKKILEQVAGLVEQYMTKLQPGTATGKDKDKGSAAGASAGGGAGAGAGAGGATTGDNVAASAAM